MHLINICKLVIKIISMRLLLPSLLLVSAGFSQQRPNIIYIMSDDHDSRAISAYDKSLIQTPNIDRIAKEGMLFTKAFVANSICGPARATLLTGQHSHKNGMKDNRTRFDSSKMTMPKILQQNGYQTAIVGKWHLHSYPTGFDYWKILPGQGQYFEPRLINMMGDTSTYHGYASNVITDEAIMWLDNRDMIKPFLLLLHHKAPHRYFSAPLKYVEQFHDKNFPEPPTLYTDMAGHGTAWQKQTMSILKDMRLCSDLKVDPKYLMDIPELKPDSTEIAYYNAIFTRIPEPDRSKIKTIYEERGKLIRQMLPRGNDLLKYKYQWYMQDYLACVASVDENIGRVLKYLDENGLSKNTILIYTSDQGMYLGQNGWFDKRWMYDVSMKTPFMVRWPGHIKAGSVNSTMIQNIDYAPTFMGAAGIDRLYMGDVQGINLLPLMIRQEKTLSRKNLYYHFYESYADHTVLPHLGIRGERYKLIYFYTVNEWELYDLKNDPDEIHNIINTTEGQKLFKSLKETLVLLRGKYEDNAPAGELN